MMLIKSSIIGPWSFCSSFHLTMQISTCMEARDADFKSKINAEHVSSDVC